VLLDGGPPLSSRLVPKLSIVQEIERSIYSPSPEPSNLGNSILWTEGGWRSPVASVSTLVPHHLNWCGGRPCAPDREIASFLKGVTAPWPHIPPLDCRLGHRRRPHCRSSPSTGLQRRGPTDVAEVAGDGTHGGLFPCTRASSRSHGG
jgi:hypothetical protein